MNSSNLDNYRAEIEGLREGGYTKTEVADFITQRYAIPTSRDSVRRAYKRWAKANVQFTNDGNTGEITGPTTLNYVTDPNELMAELGVDPKQWACERVVVNRWGDAREPQYQLKAHLKRIRPVDLVIPAVARGFVHNRDYRPISETKPKLVVFYSDPHFRFHDPKLHELFLAWMDHNQPHEGFHLGDHCDFPESSRHRHKPEWKATAMECVQSGYDGFYEIVMASRGTKWKLVKGNHDDRLANTIIDHNIDLVDLGPATKHDGTSFPEMYSFKSLLHLDDLGVELVDPGGSYDHATIRVSSKLGGTHGWLARPKSGSTALATLEALGFSVVVGHTHRKSQVYDTTHDIDGNMTQLVAMECGAMCLTRGGLGYQPRPNWQPGFVAGHVWPNGYFDLSHAIYVNGVLLWNGQRFE